MPSAHPSVIGLYSSIPACGKTTVAEILVRDHGYTHLAFAAPLKSMIRSFLQSSGYSTEVVDHFLSPQGKNVELPGLGRCTPRHLMQTLGAQWGRECISPDVWARLWHRRASQLIAQGQRIVADDVRFPNEAALIHSLSGELWRITRPSQTADPTVTSHCSEGALDDAGFHRHLFNAGDLDALEAAVTRSLRLASVETLLTTSPDHR